MRWAPRAWLLMLALLAGCGGRSGLMGGNGGGWQPPHPDLGTPDLVRADISSLDGRHQDLSAPDLVSLDLPVQGPDLGPPQKTWTVMSGGNGPNQVKALAVDSQRTVYVTGAYSGSLTLGKHTLTSSGSYDIFLARLGPDGGVLWVLGGGSPGYDSGLDVAVGPGGDVWLSGEFNGKAILNGVTFFSKGSSDIFLARISSAGIIKYLTTGGGIGLDRGLAVSVDSKTGDAYLAGSITAAATLGTHNLQASGLESFILARVSPFGMCSWAMSATSNTWSRPTEVQLATSGAVYVGGNFGDAMTLGSKVLKGTGTSHGFLASFDKAGNVVWAEAALGPKAVQMESLTTETSGSVYATGMFEGELKFFGFHIPIGTATTATFKRLFVVKVSSGGVGQWVLSDDGTSTPMGWGMAVRASPANSLYLLGNCNSAMKLGSLGVCTQGPFLARLSTTGKATWATGLLPQGGNLMELDTAGGVYLAHDEYGGQIVIYKLTP